MLHGLERLDFRGRNDEQRLEVPIERPDALRANKKLDRNRGGAGRLIFSAVYDDECVELAGLVVRKVMRLGRGKQDGGHKHSKSQDGGKPAIPKTEGQHDKSRARESKKNAEGHPGLGVAADAEKLGNQKNEREQSANEEVAETRSGRFVGRCRSGWGRAHLTSLSNVLT